MLKAAQNAAWFAAVAFFSAFFVLMVVTSSTPSKGQEQNQQQPTNSDRQTEKKIMSQPRNDNRNSWTHIKEKAKEYRDQFIEHVEKREKFYTALSGIAVAAFTFALFFATWLLWSAGERHSERQLRAYICVEKGRVVLEGRTFKAFIDIKNSGQTPAHNLFTRTRMFTESATIPFSPGPIENVEVSRAIVGPGMIINPRAELIVPPENTAVIPAVQNGTAIIYVVGRTEYRTAFGKLCTLDFRLRTAFREGDLWTLGTTPDGNEE